MAIGFLLQKLLKNNIRCYHTRPPKSASSISSSPINLGEKPGIATITKLSNTVPSPISASFLNLYDGDKTFASLTTAKLLRSTLNLHVAAMDPMVDMGMWVMKSKMMEIPGLREAILGTIKHTFYEHFCAGENTTEVDGTLARLNDAGLKGMLVYALEYSNDNVTCDRNLDKFLETVDLTYSLPPSSVSSVIVKISAICPINLLKRVSDLLRWQHRHSFFHLEWKTHAFPVLSNSSPMYHTLEEPEPLTPKEEHDLHLAQQRLNQLGQKCLDANVPLLVDAEDTAVQPAIDYITYSSAIMYNKHNHPIIFPTIQAYLKDARERLFLATKAAEKMGFPLGVKLVRGAYMSSETKVASLLGYKSPIHNSIEDTHACYNDCASFMLEKIVTGSASVVLATHNIDSGKVAAAKAKDLGIGKKNPRLEFAQLYGMSEALSFGLVNEGFVVSKYMPYGPVGMVMPYLLRRAEENRGLLSASTLDRELMRKELKRRIQNVILNVNEERLERGQV